MRRILSLVLVLCVIVSLCACNQGNSALTSNNPNNLDVAGVSGKTQVGDSLVKQALDLEGNVVKTVFYTPDGAVGGWYESEYSENGGEIKRSLYDASGELLAITGLDENGEDIGFDVFCISSHYHVYDDNNNLLVNEYDDGTGSIVRTEYMYDEGDICTKYVVIDENGNTIGGADMNNLYNAQGQHVLQSYQDSSGSWKTEFEYDDRNLIKETWFLDEEVIFWCEYNYEYAEGVIEIISHHSDGRTEYSWNIYDSNDKISMRLYYDENGTFQLAKLYLYHLFDARRATECITYAEPQFAVQTSHETNDVNIDGVDTLIIEDEKTSNNTIVTSGIIKPTYERFDDFLYNFHFVDLNGIETYESKLHKFPEHPELEMLEEYKLMKTGANGAYAYMSVYFADYKDVNAAMDDDYSYYGWATPRTGGVYNSYTQGWSDNREFQYYEIDSDAGYILSYLLDDVVLTVSCYPELKEAARKITYEILTDN